MQAVDLAIQIQFIAILTAAATADNTTTFFILYALFVLFLDFPQNLLAELSRTISLTITVR